MENQTLGQKAVEEIIELIKEKNYAPGDKLPTEKELSELLGVSRNMVREALRVLVSRNLVTIRQGAGTFLSDKAGVVDDPFGFSFVEDKEKLTADLLQIRAILEPDIAALAGGERHRQRDRGALRGAFEAGGADDEAGELRGAGHGISHEDRRLHPQHGDVQSDSGDRRRRPGVRPQRGERRNLSRRSNPTGLYLRP